MIQPHMENGIMVCKPLITQIQEVWVIFGFYFGHWGNYFNPILERNGEIRRGNGYIIDDFTNYGIEFIKKKKQLFIVFTL